jgi:hydroxymethylpyrimidine/phosphomethylpyrimidine kinase
VKGYAGLVMPALSPATPPIALTIAGFDPTSGAGVSADLKTFAANHCYGVAAITALTVQNTRATRRYEAVAAGVLAEQLDFLLADITPAAVKIGMLANADIVAVAAAALRPLSAAVVLDPVLRASSGAELLDQAGRKALLRELLPLATVLTPNLDEAATLTGRPVTNEAQMADAARALRDQGARAVVVTGGHLERPVDILISDGAPIPIGGDRVRTVHTHGTGAGKGADRRGGPSQSLCLRRAARRLPRGRGHWPAASSFPFAGTTAAQKHRSRADSGVHHPLARRQGGPLRGPDGAPPRSAPRRRLRQQLP